MKKILHDLKTDMTTEEEEGVHAVEAKSSIKSANTTRRYILSTREKVGNSRLRYRSQAVRINEVEVVKIIQGLTDVLVRVSRYILEGRKH